MNLCAKIYSQQGGKSIMKDNIYSFGDEFEKEIKSCKIDENETRKKLEDLDKKQKMILSTLHSNWETRTKIINEIRLNKVQEINDELEKSNLELNELQGKLAKILFNYCEKNGGHKYILIESRNGAGTGAFSFVGGEEHYCWRVYKCTICGHVHTFSGNSFGYPFTEEYCQEIPQEVYDDESISCEGKTFRMIKKEIDELKIYMDYLYLLKQKLCELFGHDATADSHENFTCKCCGKHMSYAKYIDTYHAAKYKGVVDFYYAEYNGAGYYMLSPGEELELSLPTFESCKESIKSKQKLLEKQIETMENYAKKRRPIWE